MKSNVIVRGLLLLISVALVALIVMKRGDEESHAMASESMGVGGGPIDENTRVALQIEGDTPTDTIKTLITGQRQQRGQLADLLAENEGLQQANSRLLKMQDQLTRQIDSGMQRSISAAERRGNDMMDKVERVMSDWMAKQERAHPVAVNFDNAAPSVPPVALTHPGAVTDSDGTVWIPPIDVATQPTFKSGMNEGPLATLLDLARPAKRKKDRDDGFLRRRARSNKPIERPAYTIAKNSTLVGATAMTALVGRVPVGNNVVDPYSFKVIVGRENLIANGKTVPELAYAIVSGKAVGDWTLGCVSGQVFSITFVFDDGRIRTLPKPADIASGAKVTPDLKIGELADDFGNPCVVGRKITNAGKYLAQRIFATTAEAAALAAASSETTTTIGAFGGAAGSTTTVTGDKGKFILDQSLAGAARETAQWIRDRQSLEFDAVYVRPGAKVAVHITEELRIDYEEIGRFTHHDDFRLRATHRELD